MSVTTAEPTNTALILERVAATCIDCGSVAQGNAKVRESNHKNKTEEDNENTCWHMWVVGVWSCAEGVAKVAGAVAVAVLAQNAVGLVGLLQGVSGVSIYQPNVTAAQHKDQVNMNKIQVLQEASGKIGQMLQRMNEAVSQAISALNSLYR